ncbi:MAG: glycoside hydrolase family 1 protein [Candidatus Binatia bacterium]
MESGEFLWGASTSAHQVEGNNVHNDWWHWETTHSGASRSGRAADHWGRFREDFALAKSLGHTAHRFSIEWSRIEPRPEQWNTQAVAHYRQVLTELRRHGMKSFVTLHHFTNPLWLAQRGGWTSSAAPEHFARYVRYISQQLGELVDFWITINEPMVYATQAYWTRRWPPQERSLFTLWQVIRHLARAHRLSYRVLHTVTPRVPVGLANHVIAYLPEHEGQLDDQLVAWLEDWWFNHRFFDLTGATHDFIGVNYYFTVKKRVHVFPPSLGDVPWKGPVSDMKWSISPEGLTHTLLHMKKYRKPLYITENGLADARDLQRADFIRDHLRAIEKAQAFGADVRGYLHWSLLDNYEWADGFTPRFGLIEVDYTTMRRRVRPSAYAYRAIIEQAQR